MLNDACLDAADRVPQIRAEYKVRKTERDLRKARREHLNERGGG
jgi:hypothetical protein